MVELGLLLGVFSYLIFALGLIGELKLLNFLGILFFVSIVTLLLKKKLWKIKIGNIKNVSTKIILLLIALQIVVNFAGIFIPELSFDALWYHLTLPKIYLQLGRIIYLPGSLFYYSAMPKLTEMLYLFSLNFSHWGTLAKFIHFLFGLFSAVALFKLARRFLSVPPSLLTVLIFYSTLIVGWQSTTAYVDLARTFYEIMALILLLNFFDNKKNIDFVESAIMIGLAISTKLIAFASLPVFLILIFVKTKKITFATFYLLLATLSVSPWLVFSFVHTGNPVYPLFSGQLDLTHRLSWPTLSWVIDSWRIFYRPDDFLSPVFLIFLPVMILARKSLGKFKILLLFFGLAFFFWLLTPRTAESRFFLPYLPVLSLLLVGLISRLDQFWNQSLIVIALLAACVNLGYRTLANRAVVPLIFGQQTRETFLAKKLNFALNDFYDIDGEIKKRVKKSDLVLVDGGHNFFYADLNFYHTSYAPKGIVYRYYLTQNTDLPAGWQLPLAYKNNQTGIKLYHFGKIWP